MLFRSNQLVYGQIQFYSKNGQTVIHANVQNLSPGKHGIHVHSAIQASANCTTACQHFDKEPIHSHGGPTGNNRHSGDFGNLVADASGHANMKIRANVDARDLLRRTIVIHANADDLGKGTNKESKLTGNSGARIAAGVILPVSDAAVLAAPDAPALLPDPAGAKGTKRHEVSGSSAGGKIVATESSQFKKEATMRAQKRREMKLELETVRREYNEAKQVAQRKGDLRRRERTIVKTKEIQSQAINTQKKADALGRKLQRLEKAYNADCRQN